MLRARYAWAHLEPGRALQLSRQPTLYTELAVLLRKRTVEVRPTLPDGAPIDCSGEERSKMDCIESLNSNNRVTNYRGEATNAMSSFLRKRWV